MLATLARWLYRFLHATLRPVVVGPASAELVRTFEGDERVIMAFWHDRLGMVYAAYRGPGACTMVSLHADGEIISRAVRGLGIRTARGSASRGAIGSLREMIRAYQSGLDLAVAVDGPRGPRHEAKLGAIHLARATGARLYPVGCAPVRRLTFRRSWDRFIVPLPFSRLFFVAAPPIRIGSDANEEEVETGRRRLEESLREVTAEAERLAAEEA